MVMVVVFMALLVALAMTFVVVALIVILTVALVMGRKSRLSTVRFHSALPPTMRFAGPSTSNETFESRYSTQAFSVSVFASAAVTAIGFSIRTGHPLAMQNKPCSRCKGVGVARTAPSISASANISSSEENTGTSSARASCWPCTLGSTIAPTLRLGSCKTAAACRLPIRPKPTTAIRVVSNIPIIPSKQISNPIASSSRAVN